MARKSKVKNQRSGAGALPQPARSGRFDLVWLGLTLFAVVFAVFYPCLGNGFVNYDDPDYAQANPHVLSGLSWSNAGWAFHETATTSNWHPMTWLSLMLDSKLFGPGPWGHHFVNVLFHAANTAVLFWALTRLTGVKWRSFFVAALFGLHPLHVQSVAWISERKDVLSTFFWFLALWTYARYCDPPSSRGRGFGAAAERRRAALYYGLTLALFGLGLMSKPMVVTLPFTLLLLDYWPLKRWEAGATRRLILEKAPFFVLTVAACMVVFIVQRQAGAMKALESVAFPVRLENAVLSCVAYIGKLIFPARLAVFYPFVKEPPALEVAMGALILAGVTTAVVAARRRQGCLALGWFWFLGTLVPVLGLVQVGIQAMADRYAYVPSVGFFLAVVWGVCELRRRGSAALPAFGTALPFVGCAVLFACAADTRREIGFWTDSITLFRRSIEVTGDNPTALVNLGQTLYEQQDFDGALSEYERALALEPDNPIVHNNIASVRAFQGRWDDVLKESQEAVRLKPDYADGHCNLGAALAQLGRLDEAKGHFQEAIRLKPDHARAHYLLGRTLEAQGRADEALAEYRESIRDDPGLSFAHFTLANALISRRQYDEAALELRETIRLTPADPAAHNTLGLLLFREKKLDEAISEFRRALKLKPDFSEAQQNLNAALRLKGG